jgi:hypothetical protein
VRFLVEHLRHMDVVRLSLFSDGQVHTPLPACGLAGKNPRLSPLCAAPAGCSLILRDHAKYVFTCSVGVCHPCTLQCVH